jgi:hydroxymethylglutaryl-CoA reductase (NADPH)
MAQQRREFVTGRTGTSLQHVGSFTLDPAQVAGNIENFLGVAQVPVGLAGPLRINGEHATGDFYIPLATTEGTLVASYNRGMRLLSESGGVTVTVVKRAMQHARHAISDSGSSSTAMPFARLPRPPRGSAN